MTTNQAHLANKPTRAIETKRINFAERAAYFRVSERTIYRWLIRGIDPNNPRSVAYHLVHQRKGPHTETLEVILAELDADTAELTEEDFSNAK